MNSSTTAFVVLVAVGLLGACIPRFLAPSDDYIEESLQPFIEVTTEEPFVFTIQPQDITAVSGEDVSFSAQVSRYSTVVTYLWQYATASDPTHFIDIPDSNFSIYDFICSSDHDDFLYRCIATYGNDTIISEPALLTVISSAELTTIQQGG